MVYPISRPHPRELKMMVFVHSIYNTKINQNNIYLFGICALKIKYNCRFFNKQVCEEKYVAKYFLTSICNEPLWVNKCSIYPTPTFLKTCYNPHKPMGHWLKCNEVINLLVNSCCETILATSDNS